jgi:hypothetical protein
MIDMPCIIKAVCQRVDHESTLMVFQEHLQQLNNLHKSLRQALTKGVDAQQVVETFLALHSQLHSKQVSPHISWSYEDFLLAGLEEAQYRQIPPGEDHSIAWIIWHLTRVEDVTMNLLVAGCDQVFEREGWLAKTGSPIKHTGNGTGLAVAQALSSAVDIDALRAYRVAVGVVTQEIVRGLTLEDFKRKVSPTHIQRILDEGAVIQPGMDVVDYWRRRDVAGLLLMPPTRHTIVHWNEVRNLLKY